MIRISKPLMGKEEEAAVMEVLSTGQLASGEYVERFEDMFKEYIGTKYAVATSNGTTALHIALLSAGIGEGDMVVTTPFSFVATSNAILYAGAVPVFTDIDENSFNIDPVELENTIRNSSRRVKAVVIVHLFGNPCNMDRIVDICDRYGVSLIEDCAQAHGAEYKGRKAGSFGLVSIFSFYPTKNMACGEGGMLVTNSEWVYEKAKKLINHGQSERYRHEILGYNYRMTNISAAIGIEQLKKLEGFNAVRIKNAELYRAAVRNDKLVLPIGSENTRHVFNQFTIKCKADRDKVIERFKENEIGYGIYYPSSIPEQPVYRKLGYTNDCPITAKLSKMVLSIPVYPGVTEPDICFIADILNGI